MSVQLHFKTLPEYLNSVKITDKEEKNITHTVMPEVSLNVYPGKYKIKEEHKDYFYNLYTKWIFNWEEEHHITEKHHPEYSPVLIDLDFRYPVDKGSERIISFMRSGIKGFSTIEEAADAVSAYLPNRKRPKDTSGLEKNLRLGDDKRYYWHWDPLFLADKGGNIKEREEREERFKQLEYSAQRVKAPTLLVQGALSDILTDEEKEHFVMTIPHSQFAKIDDATHMVVGDKNDIFAESIAKFLGDNIF